MLVKLSVAGVEMRKSTLPVYSAAPMETLSEQLTGDSRICTNPHSYAHTHSFGLSESSSALFKVITGLMSRKGTFYYRLISVYSRGCGLMSVLAECVLIQALDHCQVLARGSRRQVFVRVACDCFFNY